jgi:hypothetical protein
MSAHSQPSQQQVYEQPNNPVSKKPNEGENHNDISSRYATDTRKPNDSNPVPKPAPQARGISGSGKEAVGNVVAGNIDEEGQKLAPSSEGQVYDAVSKDQKPGTGGQEPSLTSNLETYV